MQYQFCDVLHKEGKSNLLLDCLFIIIIGTELFLRPIRHTHFRPYKRYCLKEEKQMAATKTSF